MLQPHVLFCCFCYLTWWRLYQVRYINRVRPWKELMPQLSKLSGAYISRSTDDTVVPHAFTFTTRRSKSLTLQNDSMPFFVWWRGQGICSVCYFIIICDKLQSLAHFYLFAVVFLPQNCNDFFLFALPFNSCVSRVFPQ